MLILKTLSCGLYMGQLILGVYVEEETEEHAVAFRHHYITHGLASFNINSFLFSLSLFLSLYSSTYLILFFFPFPIQKPHRIIVLSG